MKPDRVIDEIERKIRELENSLWIDNHRLDKGWKPCIIPEIVELQNAVKILETSEAKPCCGDINSEGCACMNYINERNKRTNYTLI